MRQDRSTWQPSFRLFAAQNRPANRAGLRTDRTCFPCFNSEVVMTNTNTETTAPKKTGKFAPGQCGNPAGRPPGPSKYRKLVQAFADEHAEDLLKIVIGHAYNDARVAMELTTRIFGTDWLRQNIRAMLGTLNTETECKDAQERAIGAYSIGEINLVQFDRLETLITRKLAKLKNPSHEQNC
jgi:hypothetical protein